MYCRKCGAEIPDANRFCEQCGARVATRDRSTASGASSAGIKSHKRTEIDKSKSQPGERSPFSGLKGKKLIAVVVAIVVLFGGIGSVTAVVSSHKNADYNDKLASAQKYLDDGDYEAAIKTFDSAIEIKPKKAKGYLAKAKAQFKHGDKAGAIDTLEDGREKVRDKTEIERELNTVKKEYEADWKTAYIKILTDNEASIRTYEDSDTYDDNKGTALCDLDEDGTPELLIIKSETDHSILDFKMHVYSYDGKTAKEIDYSIAGQYTNQDDKVETEEYSILDVSIAGGGDCGFIVFKEKGRPGMTCYSLHSDDTYMMDLNSYSMTEKSEMKRTNCLSRLFNTLYGTSNDTYDIPENTYINDGKEIAEKEFENKMDDHTGNIDKVIMIGRAGSSTYDKEVWDAARKFKPESKTFDEMIAALEDGSEGSEAEAHVDSKYPIYLDVNKEGLEVDLNEDYSFVMHTSTYDDPIENNYYEIINRKNGQEKVEVSETLSENREMRCVGKYGDLFYFDEMRDVFQPTGIYTYKIGDRKLKKLKDDINLDKFKSDTSYPKGGTVGDRYTVAHEYYPTDGGEGMGPLHIYDLKKNKTISLGHVDDYIYLKDSIRWVTIQPHLWEHKTDTRMYIKEFRADSGKISEIKTFELSIPDFSYGAPVIDEEKVKLNYLRNDGQQYTWSRKY